jgi:hypothetical protein
MAAEGAVGTPLAEAAATLAVVAPLAAITVADTALPMAAALTAATDTKAVDLTAEVPPGRTEPVVTAAKAGAQRDIPGTPTAIRARMRLQGASIPLGRAVLPVMAPNRPVGRVELR